MTEITTEDWTKLAETVNAFSDSASGYTVTWKKYIGDIDRYREQGDLKSEDREMKTLVDFNAFRTWPQDKRSEQGTIDKEYCALYLNKAYLSTKGWLTANRNFDFNPGMDRFVIDGTTYKPSGDTTVSQTFSDSLFIILILEREAYVTSKEPR